MNYTKLLAADVVNGLGFRTTLWVTGCLRGCPGCFNKEAQCPTAGIPFDAEAREKLFNELSKSTCDGLSLMGGEPLSRLSDNRVQTIQLCKECKKRFPDKDIWIWSGYTYEEIESNPDMKDILKYIDVLIDGPFIQERKDLSCPFRGSTNQRVIDVVKTLNTGSIQEKYFD